MFKKFKLNSLFSKLMVSYLVVILATLVVLSGIMSYLLEEYFYGAREWEVNVQAREVADMIEEPLKENDVEELIEITRMLSRSFEAKIGVFDDAQNNLVVANYEGDEEENRGEETVQVDQQELEYVLEGNSLTKKLVGPQAERLLIAIPVYFTEEEENGFVTAVNFSDQDRAFKAEATRENFQPRDIELFQDAEEDQGIVGVVTMNVPLVGLEDTLSNISRITLMSGGVAILVAGAFALSLSKKITKPLSNINETAKALAKGERFSDMGYDVSKEKDDELGQISRTFNLAAKEIEKTMAEQKRLAIFRKHLVDNASHEFRAPLSSIRGYSELMLDGVVPSEQQEKYLNLIWKNAVELNKMVDDLLDLSSLESDSINLEKETQQPQRIFEMAVDTVLPMLKQKDQRLEMDVSHTDMKFMGDSNRVKQIFVNLIRNAIQYTPNKGKITLRSFYKEGYVAMQVADTGVGIPEDEHETIFQRFYKVDKSRNNREHNRNTGLGLAITNELVRLHRGWIELESEVGKGSVFTVYFPAYNYQVKSE